MTWQTVIILQIIASTGLILYTREISLAVKRVFFGVGILTYFAVAVAGWIILLSFGHGHIAAPSAEAWKFLIIEGLTIPASWLVQYKLITHIGASNTAIATTANTLMAGLGGILYLHDKITLPFFAGAILLFSGVLTTLLIRADETHRSNMKNWIKLILILAGAVLYAIGMVSEKTAINHIGTLDYMGFGWSLQFVGALAIFLLFGLREIPRLKPKIIKKGVLLGIFTSLSGALYISALGLGQFSNTIVATSGRLALVAILAAVFLRERNALRLRVLSFLLCITGLWFIL